MRFLVKHGVWIQAATAAALISVLATTMAITAGWLNTWRTLRTVDHVEPYEIVGVMFTTVFITYIIAIPLLTWLFMLPRRRLLPGLVCFFVSPVYATLVGSLYQGQLVVDTVSFIGAGLLVGTTATMAIVWALQRTQRPT